MWYWRSETARRGKGQRKATGRAGVERKLTVDRDILDDKERLAVLLGRILECNVERDALAVKADLEQALVLEGGEEAALLVEPVGNLLGVEPEAVDVEPDRGVVVGRVGGKALSKEQVVVVDDPDVVRDE